MNDFSELEAELQQLRPLAPSAELSHRIERALEQPNTTATPTAGVLPRPARPRFAWFFAGLGAAAAAALVLLARVNVDTSTSPHEQTIASRTPSAAAAQRGDNLARDGFVAEGFTRVVYNQRDEGLFFPEEAEAPVRRVRSTRQDTLAWRNPQTGASLRVSFPVEEVQFIPVSGQ
jgi:hypothetical protein